MSPYITQFRSRRSSFFFFCSRESEVPVRVAIAPNQESWVSSSSLNLNSLASESYGYIGPTPLFASTIQLDVHRNRGCLNFFAILTYIYSDYLLGKTLILSPPCRYRQCIISILKIQTT